MKNTLLIFFIFGTLLPSFAQTEIGNIVLPNQQTFGKHTLILNGAGIKEKWWMDMFVGGLYLPTKSQDAKAILESKNPIAVKLHIVSNLISSSRLVEAIDDGFQKSMQGNTAAIEKEIENFKAFFQEKVSKNDVFDFVHEPGLGLVVYKNNRQIGRVASEDFRVAFFRMWLSETPAMPEMKEAMLGVAEK